MAKPLGIVAMLALLTTSGTALADERLFIRTINLWGITTHGNLYLETKTGDGYIAELKHCPVVKTTDGNTPQFTPVEVISEMEDPRLHISGRFVQTDKTLRVYDRSQQRGRVEAKCTLGDLRKITT